MLGIERLAGVGRSLGLRSGPELRSGLRHSRRDLTGLGSAGRIEKVRAFRSGEGSDDSVTKG
jgi:hypothetical protein